MRPELDNLPQPNWFWHGETILGILERYRPMICLEVGTNRGCSAIATARLLKMWDGHLACIDGWESTGSSVSRDECQQNINTAGVGSQIVLWQGTSLEMAKLWVAPIDYLYIDAMHTEPEVTADLEAWWPHVRVGGLVAGDDYEDPYDDEIPQQVTRAWDAFEKKYDQAFERTVTPGLAGACGRPASRLIWGVKR